MLQLDGSVNVYEGGRSLVPKIAQSSDPSTVLSKPQKVSGINNAVGVAVAYCIRRTPSGPVGESTKLALLADGGLAKWYGPNDVHLYSAAQVHRATGNRDIVSIQDSLFILNDGTARAGLIEQMDLPNSPVFIFLRRPDAESISELLFSTRRLSDLTLRINDTPLKHVQTLTPGFVLAAGNVYAVKEPSLAVIPKPVITNVAQISTAVALLAGDNRVFVDALKADGTVVRWASHVQKDGSRINNPPSTINGLTGIRQVIAAQNASYFIDQNGAAYEWLALDTGGIGQSPPIHDRLLEMAGVAPPQSPTKPITQLRQITEISNIIDLRSDENGFYAVVRKWGGEVDFYMRTLRRAIVLEGTESCMQEAQASGGIMNDASPPKLGVVRAPISSPQITIYEGHLHEALKIDTSDGPVTFGFGPRLGNGGINLIPTPGEIDEGKGYGDIHNLIPIISYPISLKDGDRIVKGLRKLALDPPLYHPLSFKL